VPPTAPLAALTPAEASFDNLVKPATTTASLSASSGTAPIRSLASSTPSGSGVQQLMTDLLLKDLRPQHGLTAQALAQVVAAIGGNRVRFRSVRHNLKHNAAVARAFARGDVSVQSIVDLSAFSRGVPEGAPIAREQQPRQRSHSPAEYRYRGGQYLPVEALHDVEMCCEVA